MVKPITVKELKRDLDTIIKMGLGDRQIFVATDDEGNGYRPMYYSVTTDKEEIEACIDMGLMYENVKPEDIVILG